MALVTLFLSLFHIKSLIKFNPTYALYTSVFLDVTLCEVWLDFSLLSHSCLLSRYFPICNDANHLFYI
ncbi:hypothetical protein PRUPE_1G158600 [Prunus persica]|uniref:Uncharacterized protein n=1 Tax=Prunus persica TaxID=3760 RepID=A0A251QYA6_PRUPE|nr:hypothetical protein PRUPE_1G158600 [Prunus persica]